VQGDIDETPAHEEILRFSMSISDNSVRDFVSSSRYVRLTRAESLRDGFVDPARFTSLCRDTEFG
jgi:hypothetical protein